jgi:hypothetical protein
MSTKNAGESETKSDALTDLQIQALRERIDALKQRGVVEETIFAGIIKKVKKTFDITIVELGDMKKEHAVRVIEYLAKWANAIDEEDRAKESGKPRTPDEVEARLRELEDKFTSEEARGELFRERGDGVAFFNGYVSALEWAANGGVELREDELEAIRNTSWRSQRKVVGYWASIDPEDGWFDIYYLPVCLDCYNPTPRLAHSDIREGDPGLWVRGKETDIFICYLCGKVLGYPAHKKQNASPEISDAPESKD